METLMMMHSLRVCDFGTVSAWIVDLHCDTNGLRMIGVTACIFYNLSIWSAGVVVRGLIGSIGFIPHSRYYDFNTYMQPAFFSVGRLLIKAGATGHNIGCACETIVSQCTWFTSPHRRYIVVTR